jgi:glycosyltransferase involved in cell wall biosynthesis
LKNSFLDFSVIIPTFNRYHFVTSAIDSAIAFLQCIDLKGEIIVVDDGSTDDTYRLLLSRYKVKNNNHHLSLFSNSANIGVTKTRNKGVLASKGKWLMFLDSDDQLIQSSAKKVWRTIIAYKKEKLFFFRAEDMHTEQLIGKKRKKVHTIDLKNYLNNGPPGECLPVVRSDIFKNIMFYEPLLAGEGYTWARVIQSCGSAVISPLIVRRYRTKSTDRLSTRSAMLRRANDMSLYN